jgi:hypothetical protein
MQKIATVKQAGTDFKMAQGTSGPMVQGNPVGRPGQAPMIPQMPVVNRPAAEAPTPAPEEFRALVEQYADARAAVEKLEPFATAANAGPRIRYHYALARRQVVALAEKIKTSTPDFI